MSAHFADRLIAAIKAKGAPACVGIDPVVERIPSALPSTDRPIDRLHGFCRGVIEAVAPIVPAVKLNVGFFEPYRGAGVDLYFKLIEQARALGLVVIGDVKRGDVGHTARRYADACLSDNPGKSPGPDAVTVHAYLGRDAVQPFIDIAESERKGVYVLVRTSNASATEVQGITDREGTPVSLRVAERVHDWGASPALIGDSGYSAVGAVVAPRDADETTRLRSAMPQTPWLVPGFGAQGIAPGQIRPCFGDDGFGAIVSSSRGVIFAFENHPAGAAHWQTAVADAAKKLVDDLRTVWPNA